MSLLFPGTILPTTVVGSYPVVTGKGFFGIFDPFRDAVRTAVSDQLAAGIDIISDGQVRGDMVKIFTSRLPGVRGADVIGKVSPPEGPITLGDTRYAISRAERVKGIITGPTTLSFALHISTPVYRDRSELALDLAYALAQEAQFLAAAGAAVIQIDEPILSTGVADLTSAREALEVLARGITVPVCLHVCGDLTPVISELARMPVGILDFECAKSPGNLALCREMDFGKRMIGFGCVDSSSPIAESADTIRSRIETALSVFAPEQLLVDPDCGLRMLPRDVAYLKLARMVEAVQEVRNNL
ncbi:MAG: methionine synthase [Methanoregulaceae archaeon]|jgi:5-methyltetrahydropteroyltriglutamate--homocysteine methyltransferase|nr:methionine synthase [Methanoregulaceae archaeon]MCU0628998.1 methionine synthase [Methanoregulaceae archaeon]